LRLVAASHAPAQAPLILALDLRDKAAVDFGECWRAPRVFFVGAGKNSRRT